MAVSDTLSIVFYLTLITCVIVTFGLLSWSIVSGERRSRKRDKEFETSWQQIDEKMRRLIDSTKSENPE